MSKRSELLIFAACMVVFAALIMNLVVLQGGATARAITAIAIVVVGSIALLGFYELRERKRAGDTDSGDESQSKNSRSTRQIPRHLFPHLMFLLGVLLFLSVVGALQWRGLVTGRVAIAIHVVALPFVVWFAARLKARKDVDNADVDRRSH